MVVLLSGAGGDGAGGYGAVVVGTAGMRSREQARQGAADWDGGGRERAGTTASGEGVGVGVGKSAGAEVGGARGRAEKQRGALAICKSFE